MIYFLESKNNLKKKKTKYQENADDSSHTS